MIEVPAVTPVTTPAPAGTVENALLLLQVPPTVASVNVVVKPTQTAIGPDIAAGNGLTVTVAVAIQPVGNV